MKVSICPLVQMKNNIFFFISSKSEKGSAQSCGLMETIRASGEFRIHQVVTVCADCRKNGVAWNCMHAPRPPWKVVGQQLRKAAILMQGDERTRAREFDNLEVESRVDSAFNVRSVEWMLEGERWCYNKPIGGKDFVFVGIDPAAGGSKSRYAIISAVFHRETVNSAEKLVVRIPIDPSIFFWQSHESFLWCSVWS